MGIPTLRCPGFTVSAGTLDNLATTPLVLTTGIWRVGYVHVRAFDEPNLSNIYFPVAAAIKAASLALALAVECWDPATFREELVLPPGFPGSPRPTFADPAWVAAYRDHVVGLATAVEPAYLCIGVEANAYFDHNPSDWPNFLAMFTEVRTAVRTAVPGCKVYCSFIYEKLTGLDGGGGQPSLLVGGADEVTDQDVYGLTVYPRFGFGSYDPITLSDDYFAPVAGQGIGVVIDELGWHTAPASLDGVTFAGTDQLQADFLRRFCRMAAALPELEFVNWTAVHDFEDGELTDIPELGKLGLLTHDLTPKPAWWEFVTLRSDKVLVRDGGRDLPNNWTATGGATDTWQQDGVTVDPGGGCFLDYVPGKASCRLPIGSGATTLTAGQHYWDDGTDRIYVRLPDGSHPGSRISVCANAFAFLDFSPGTILSRIEFRRFGTAAVGMGGANQVLRNCTIRDCQSGIFFNADHPTVMNVCFENIWGFNYIVGDSGVDVSGSPGTIDYNRLNAAIVTAINLETGAMNLAQWRTATGGEANTTEGAPNLQPSGVPRATSPVVGAGAEIDGVTDGFPGDAPDIGAYTRPRSPNRILRAGML
jgi:hypothetical protein